MSQSRLVNWVAVVVLAVATFFSAYWVWGALFLFWSVRAFGTGSAFLIGPIEKRTEPLLYWIVTIAWAGFGLLYLSDILTFF